MSEHPSSADRVSYRWVAIAITSLVGLLITGCGSTAGSSGKSDTSAHTASTDDSAYTKPCQLTFDGFSKAFSEITDKTTGQISVGSGSIASMLRFRMDLSKVASKLDLSSTPADLAKAVTALLTDAGDMDVDGSGTVNMTAAQRAHDDLSAVVALCSQHGVEASLK